MITYPEIQNYTNNIKTPPFISSSNLYIQLYNRLGERSLRNSFKIYAILSYAVHKNYTPLL